MEQIFPKKHLFKSNIYKNVCLLLFLLFSLRNYAQQVSVNDSLYSFEKNLNPHQALQQIDPSGFKFIKVKDRRRNFGLTGCEYHYIILKLAASKPLSSPYLYVDNTSLDTVYIFRIYENGTDSLLYLGGQLVPFDKTRNYIWHAVPVEIKNTPTYYCIAVKASQKNINVKYDIAEENVLLKKYQGYERIVFFFIGIAFMISAAMVLAFILFKKPVFAAYLAYMVCISAWIVAHYGRIFPYVYPRLPIINNITKPLSSLGAGLFLLIVLRLIFASHLQQEKKLYIIIKSTQRLLLVSAAGMLLLLYPGLGNALRAGLIMMWHIELVFLIGLIIFIPFHFFSEGSTAKIFSVAMLVISAMTLIQLFANAGFIESYFLNEHGMALGTLVENSIMAFGLFYGLLEERRNKDLQVRALEEAQTATLKKLISVQDKERKRIAGDLHDNIGPLLAALKINVRRIINVKEEPKQIELVRKTENIIDDSIIEIRNVAHNLMPKNLSSKGLINTMSDYFEDMEQLYGKKIIFNHDVQSIFDPDLQMNLYRIICELVMNAAKHSDADVITVSLYSGSDRLTVFVKDNGHGFEVKHNGNKKSLGIQSAESRVQYLMGKFKLQSAPGKGSAINIEIPL